MGKKSASALRVPKTKCCVSSSRCGRCPIRLLAEGNLPDGYTVKKRRLVREPLVIGTKQGKKSKQSKKVAKLADRKITKSELEKAIKRTKRRRKAMRAA